MKKSILNLLGLVAVLFLAACNDGGMNGNKPEDSTQQENNTPQENITSTPTQPQDPVKNPMEDLLPHNSDEQKGYLEQAARLFLETFRARDQKAVLDLTDELYFEIENYDWDTQGFEEFWDEIESDFAFAAPRYISQLANGSASPMDVRQFTYNLAKFANVFEADSRSHRWVNKGKSSDGSAQLIYKMGGSTCVAKVWGDGKDNTYNYTFYRGAEGEFSERYTSSANEKITMTATLPERMCMTLTQDGVELVRLVVGTDIVENQHYNQNITLTVANINYISQINCSHTSANAVFGLNYGNQAIMYAEIKVPNYSIPTKTNNQTYEEYGEHIADHWEDIVNSVGTATAYINMMGTVQLRAAVTNVGDLVADYRNWIDNYDSYMNEHMTREAARALCNIYKHNSRTGVYYGTNDRQAELVLDSYMDNYYYYSNRSYLIEPLIHFISDDTQYSFTEYFTEARYANIIDLTENLVNSYLRMLRSFDVDPIELR